MDSSRALNLIPKFGTDYVDSAATITLANARITATLIDEDNMGTNSATRIPSQQSVKAYVDAQVATKDNTDEMTEGSSNLYFTNARADARITAALIDEDNMSSNSATRLPTQQSVKAYVDAVSVPVLGTDFIDSAEAVKLIPVKFTDYVDSAEVLKLIPKFGTDYVDSAAVNTLADARIANNIVDEDNMSTNSATRAPSQQSTKAYIDAQTLSLIDERLI